MSEATSGVPLSVYEKAQADMHRYKNLARDLKAKLAESDARIAEAVKARETAEKAAADAAEQVKALQASPGEWQAKYEAAAKELRSRDHRSAWEKAAKEYKGEKGEVINPTALDALYKLTGGMPEGDDPKAMEPATLTETIRAAVAANAFVLQAPQGEARPGQQGPTPNTTPGTAGPGIVRGAPDSGTHQPRSVADAILGRFEATRGPGASPNRIA
jgi:hypothetical protein